MLTPVPAGVTIKRLPARVARGAYKPKSSGGGAAKTTADIYKTADRRVIKGLAARGW